MFLSHYLLLVRKSGIFFHIFSLEWLEFSLLDCYIIAVIFPSFVIAIFTCFSHILFPASGFFACDLVRFSRSIMFVFFPHLISLQKSGRVLYLRILTNRCLSCPHKLRLGLFSLTLGKEFLTYISVNSSCTRVTVIPYTGSNWANSTCWSHSLLSIRINYRAKASHYNFFSLLLVYLYYLSFLPFITLWFKFSWVEWLFISAFLLFCIVKLWVSFPYGLKLHEYISSIVGTEHLRTLLVYWFYSYIFFKDNYKNVIFLKVYCS